MTSALPANTQAELARVKGEVARLQAHPVDLGSLERQLEVVQGELSDRRGHTEDAEYLKQQVGAGGGGLFATKL